MTSELKSATARANGAKSRGPKTAETRERSSRNSLRHGIVARKTILLECEDPDQFHAMIDEYAVTYQPRNAIEQDLVDEMISARWRGGRLAMIVSSLMDMQMDQQRQTAQPPASTDRARPIATAFMSLVDQSKAVALAMRYEARLRRVHERAFSTLRELQRERKMESGAQDPVDPVAANDGGPATKPSECEQAPSAAAPCAPKKISINEPTVRFPLKIFHPYARSKAAR